MTIPAATMPATDSVDLDRDGARLLITAPGYRLEIRDIDAALARAPLAVLRDTGGRKWAELSLLSSVHTRTAADETWSVDLIEAEPVDGDVVIRVLSRSSAWEQHELELRCTPAGIETRVTVEGAGELTDVTVFGGRATMVNSATGTFRSDARFRGVAAPAATEPVQLVRPAASPASLGVVGDADPGRLNAVFSPPPLVFGLSRKRPTSATELPGGAWFGLHLRAPVEELTMTAVRYRPLDGGFLMQLDYEGHTVVDGRWTSPTFVLRPAEDGWEVLEAYRRDLVEHGCAPAGPPMPAERWWREPLFCGWGAQCARAAHRLHDAHSEPTSDTAPETSEEEPLVVRRAPSFAREDVYDEFLARLAAHDLDPGTIVIDDRWQAAYGSAEVDLDHWPDLRRWIADRHAEGRKVLLWWKAWDAEGIPPEECVRDAGGRPVTVDAGNDAYLARLDGIIRHLLSPDGLDADGLKIDFTQRGPSGESLTRTTDAGPANVWGIAALHRLLGTIYGAAKQAKPDSLVIAHAVHPSFGDVCDMVRLNDVSKRDVKRKRVPVVDQLAFRHAIASRMLPGHLIDTDQWPMPSRAQWLAYVEAQPGYGVPALYYLEAIDRSGERIHPEDLQRVAASWRRYRETLDS